VKFAPQLQKGVLVRRYKRFLADVITAAGTPLTIHCPNTGAMLGCSDPGSEVWFSTSKNQRRKYPHTLELVKTTSGDLIGVNPARANDLVAEAISAGTIVELNGYGQYRREVPVPDAPGRFDFWLNPADTALQRCSQRVAGCYLEVKSVTLGYVDGTGGFPDAVSARALRHVVALQRRVAAGQRAALLYCVQHSGIERVRCAAEIDPAYAAAVAEAAAHGVEVLAYKCRISSTELVIEHPLEVLI